MPSHRVHRAFVESILGKKIARQYDWVNKLMDLTASMGPGHRNHPIHNPFVIFLLTGDPIAFQVALLHDYLDKFEKTLSSRKK